MRTSREPSSPAWLVALGAAVAAPYCAYSNFVLNHFYHYGAVLLDTGLLADLAWRKPWWLPMAPLFGGQSFYAFHVSPLLSLLSAVSRIVPLGMPQWFAAFTGAAHALAAAAAFLALRYGVGLRGAGGTAIAVALSILFAFNGLALAQVRYPHFEILIASAMMLFFVAWRLGWMRRALAALALCLICREDAGFHVAAFLLTVVALDWRRGVARPDQRRTLALAALAAGYSCAALAAGHLAFPHASSFVRVYLGSPPLSGLTPSVVAGRVLIILYGRSYLVLPAAVAAVWAVLRRNPYVFAGYLACAPWAMVNLLAQSELAARLDSYYGFPFMAAAFWPLVGASMGGEATAGSRRATVTGFALMTLASFTALGLQHNPSRIPLWSGLTRPVPAAEQRRVDAAVDAVLADRSRLGRLVVSNGIAALHPPAFSLAETTPVAGVATYDTAIDMSDGFNSGAVRAAAARSGLGRVYRIAGTSLRIETNRDLRSLPALGPQLTAASSP